MLAKPALFPGGDFSNRFCQKKGDVFLHKITTNLPIQKLADVIRVRLSADDQGSDAGARLLQLVRDLIALYPRQMNIHNQHIWAQLSDILLHFVSTARFSNHLYPALACEDLSDGLSDQFVIIYQDDFNFFQSIPF